MKIAITGGSGFIGRRLAALLEKDGHECVILDTLALNPVDIENPQAVIEATRGCEAIYHLAAAHRDDIFPRSRYYDVNVGGTENIIHAAVKNDINKIIFTSTFAVYGLNTGMPDENSKPAPFNDYGQSKLDAEGRLKDWAADDRERSAVIVRPVVVFGEGNRGNVHTLIDQISRGRFVMVGSGRNKKSMAYVGNVAGFLHHALSLGAGTQIYNYADKPDFDMQELTDILYTKLGLSKPAYHLPYMCGLGAGYAFDGLARITGRRFPISAVRVQKFCADTTCAAEKLKETGFTPDFTLEDGLTRMIVHDFANLKPQEKKCGMSNAPVKFLMVLNDLDWFWSHRLPLARGIMDRGWDLHLACARAGENERLKDMNVTGHDLPDHQDGQVNPFVIPMRLIELAKVIYREKPDLIHAITLRYVLYTGFVCRLMMTGPVVFTVAGLGLLFSSRSWKMRILRFALWPLLKFVFWGKNRHVIFQNPDDLAMLVKFKIIDEDQATLIRGSGVDLQEFSYTPEQPALKLRVLFSSRLIKDKGIYEFVQVAKHLKQKGAAAEFVVAGKTYPGNPGSIAQEVIEDWHARGIVNWLGQVENMPDILTSSAIVVLPSYYGEGVPKILLEAAATGRPIITCDMPGCREAVVDEVTGFLVPPRDAHTLSDAVEYLLDNKSVRDQMGKAGRQHVESDFEVGAVVDKTLGVYDGALAGEV